MTKIPENNPPGRIPRDDDSKKYPKHPESQEKPSKKFQFPPEKKHSKDDLEKIEVEAKMDIGKSKKPHEKIIPDVKPDEKTPFKPNGKEPVKPKILPEKGDKKENFRPEKDKSEKDKPEKEQKSKEDISDKGLLQAAPIMTKMPSTPVKETGKTERLTSVATQAVQKIREVILKMVNELHIGTIGGKSVQQMDLKKTSDVPSFLQGASVIITREAQSLSVNISNLNAANIDMAIKAMETQQAELKKLVEDLGQRNMAITELRIGEHSIALPRVEAPPPTPFTVSSEGYREHGRDEGGGGRGGERGGGGREGGQQKQGREQR